MVYVPAVSEVMSSVIELFVQLNVYPGVPPLTLTFIAPVAWPKQPTAVIVAFCCNALAGCVRITVDVNVHPSASVNKTVYVPLPIFVKS